MWPCDVFNSRGSTGTFRWGRLVRSTAPNYSSIDHLSVALIHLFISKGSRPRQITFCRCMFLVSCSSNMFCSFLFISLRFSSPGFTRSLRTEPRPPRSPWEPPWPPTALPDTSEEERRRQVRKERRSYWADRINKDSFLLLWFPLRQINVSLLSDWKTFTVY